MPFKICAVLAVQTMLDNEPLLTLAVRRGVQETVVALIEAGANANARDKVRASTVCPVVCACC